MARSKKSVSASVFGRGRWTRCPIQRAHSSPKGERGYSRRKAKRELRRLVREV